MQQQKEHKRPGARLGRREFVGWCGATAVKTAAGVVLVATVGPERVEAAQCGAIGAPDPTNLCILSSHTCAGWNLCSVTAGTGNTCTAAGPVSGNTCPPTLSTNHCAAGASANECLGMGTTASNSCEGKGAINYCSSASSNVCGSAYKTVSNSCTGGAINMCVQKNECGNGGVSNLCDKASTDVTKNM